jgi:hypothetical protein
MPQFILGVGVQQNKQSQALLCGVYASAELTFMCTGQMRFMTQ